MTNTTKILLDLRDYLDLSNYPRNHPIFDKMDEKEYKDTILCNKGVLGKFKDEAKGKNIDELIILRPKMYSILCKEDNTITKTKGKGIKESTMKRIKHEDYWRCLISSIICCNLKDGVKLPSDFKKYAIQECKFYNIMSKKHKITTNIIEKESLCCIDSKRYWLNGFDSLPYGHYKIKYSK